jgi:DNA polymerase I-like protein with 3'-5' exonuclease and polymerase domains
MKERFFAWLYNPEAQDHRLEEHYDKSKLKDEFWDGKEIRNPFGRRVHSDEKHSINYLIQSTTNDIVLENSLKVREILASKRSTIAFTLHDSIILDFSKEDRKGLMEIVKTFQDTRLGHYRVNVKIGKNFGEMKDIKII